MGPVLGLVVMGAGLAAAELVVGLFERTSSPVVPVGQVFIDWVPRPLKDWAIETFGTNDKVVLVLGALIVFRAGSFIPVPGVNPEAMLQLMESQRGTIIDVFNMFSGGALERVSIFALGVMP